MQANEPDRSGEQIGAGHELAAKKSLGAALANVARVNVLEKRVGDEVVANEPDEDSAGR